MDKKNFEKVVYDFEQLEKLYLEEKKKREDAKKRKDLECCLYIMKMDDNNKVSCFRYGLCGDDNERIFESIYPGCRTFANKNKNKIHIDKAAIDAWSEQLLQKGNSIISLRLNEVDFFENAIKGKDISLCVDSIED